MGTQEILHTRPSFFKVLHGNFTNQLRIPFNFIENFNGMIPVDAILRSPSGRCWTVNVAEEEDGLFFREGWPDFVRKHGLECDDFITVKYLGNSQFKVKLYTTNGCEKELPLPRKNRRDAETSIGNRKIPSLPRHILYSEQEKEHKKRCASLSPSKRPYKKNKCEGTWKKQERPYSGQERQTRSSKDGEGTSTLPTASLIGSHLLSRIDGKERTAQVVSSFKSRYPFFAVFIGESYLSQGYMHVPNGFAWKHLPKSTNNYKIIVYSSESSDNMWPVKYTAEGHATKLSKGWTQLRRGLDLEEGDVCVFELIKKKQAEMRVSIFRVQ